MQIDPQEQWRLLIGGDGVAPSDPYEVVDPSTTSVVGHAPEATVADAEAAIAAANQALPGWRSTPMADRCALLGRLSDILAERSGDWASLVQAETGATMKIAQTLQLGGTFVDRFRYYARPRDLDVAEKPMPAGASALGPAGQLPSFESFAERLN